MSTEFNFGKFKKKEASEPLTPKEKNTDLEPISEPKEILSVKNIEKIEKEPLTPEKDIDLEISIPIEDIEIIYTQSGISVKAPLTSNNNRILAGVGKHIKLKNYSRMRIPELFDGIMNRIAQEKEVYIKTLKGGENNGE